MEWVTYSRECGFNIIQATDEQDAEMQSQSQDAICLDPLFEFDVGFIRWLRRALI
jgi:hypothetical protein